MKRFTMIKAREQMKEFRKEVFKNGGAIVEWRKRNKKLEQEAVCIPLDEYRRLTGGE